MMAVVQIIFPSRHIRESFGRAARGCLWPAIVSALLIVAAPEASLADRKPTSQERFVIERALRSQGYRRGGDIEIEKKGRVWEIDAALAPNGRRYDLKMSAETFQIIKRKRD